ncbi:MAG: thiamine-phosphate synthase family protein [Thermofilaceae archaeon]
MIPADELKECYLSPLRAMLAKELRGKGWGQRAISRVLGVSQAAVSKLLSEERGLKLAELGIDELESELLVGRLLELLASGRVVEASALAHRYWLLVAASGGACRLHKRDNWSLVSCTACTLALYPRLTAHRGRALADLERAVVLAESSMRLASVAPEVMVNVARAVPGAAGLRDVAAVPGRLAKVGGRLVARRRPAFGASKHLAEVLLASGYTACIDIKFDERVDRALVELGLERAEFSSEDYHSPNPAAAAVHEMRLKGALPRIVVDTGGRGIEPVTYIFGTSAVEVVLLAERVARSAATLPSP